MARAITSGAQRLMEQFLSTANGRSAFYNEQMELIWTNYHEFFDNFDLKKISEEVQIKDEIELPAEINGGKAVLSITPAYKSLRIITAYVCVIKTSYEVYKLMAKTDIADFSNNMMDKTNEKLERLTELNDCIKEAVQGGENADSINDLLREQKRLLVSMRNETKYCMDTCYNKTESTEVSCNLSMMFDALCKDAEQSFRDLGRKVNFEGESRDYYIVEDSKALVTAFLHLLRSHIIMSPLKSNLNISAYYEQNGNNSGNFCVSIKTKLNPVSKTAESDLTTARAYRELAKKVVLYDYNGSFECDDDDKNMLSVIRFPVLKKNRGPMLTTSNSWYLNSGNRVLHTYMLDIIEREINELEQAKMETSRKKKLAKHD